MPRLWPRVRAVLVTLLDLTIVVAAAAALVILLGGGTRVDLGGVRVSLRGTANFAIIAAVAAALRLWLGRGLAVFPTIARPDRSRIDAELGRFRHPPPRPPRFAAYAAAAVLGSLIWLTPHLVHPRWVPDRGDPIFSAWRLARFTHQLTTDPRRLFDGNIFYPARDTLTYSDATVLEGIAASPFLLLGIDPLVVSNALFLIAFPLNALAFFYAGWRLTGDPRVAVITGIAGSLYPFHAEHYSHLELQYTFFIPLAFIALLDLLAAPSTSRGLKVGLLVALQWLASMYLGLMLLTVLVPFGAAIAIAWRVRPTFHALRAFAAAGLVVAIAFAALAWPYLRSASTRGDRSLQTAETFSALPSDYGRSHPRLATHGWLPKRSHHPEREMFPGVTTFGFAIAGAVPPLSAAAVAMLASGALAFEWSLGTNGLSYDDLYRVVRPYRGIRVPARFSMIVGSLLVLLGAFGCARLLGLADRAGAGRIAAVALALAVLIDLRIRLELQDYWKTPPPIYAAVTPDMVLAEFPWDPAFDYLYFSTGHWAQLLNGYSGSSPDAFLELQKKLQTFPSAESIAAVRAAGATHVTFNCRLEPRVWRCGPTIEMLDANPLLEPVAAARWEGADVRLYRFR